MVGFGIQKRGTSKILVKRKKFEDGGLFIEENKNETISKENKKEPTTYEKKQQLIKERQEKIKEKLEQKGYETGKAKYAREKDIESPKMQNILKKYRENIADPTSKFIGKITPIGEDYGRGSDKARKELLGYKKGGFVCRGNGKAMRTKKTKIY
jgi:hypothetical protein